jgi:hypothetical protein
MVATQKTAARRERFDPRAESVPPAAQLLVMGFLALVAASRAPYLLTQGRFWAEDATVHFRHMYIEPGPLDLFYVQPRAGYSNLFADVATWLASNVALERAPLVIAWLCLAAILTVAWVALSSPSALLPVAGTRIAAAVLIVVGTLAAPEVWLAAINTQTYFGVLAVLMLFVAVDELSRRRFVASALLLGVAALSGPYGAALAPLFVVVAVLDRTLRRRIFAAIVSVAALVHIAGTAYYQQQGRLAETRGGLPSTDGSALGFAGWHVGGFVIGPGPLAGPIDAARDGSVAAAVLVGAIALTVVLFLFALLRTVPDRRVPLLLLGAFIIIEAMVNLGSLTGTGNRYALVPIAILIFMTLHGAACSDHPWLPKAAMGLTAVVLVAGLAHFWAWHPTQLRCVDCPPWEAEVDAWRAGDTDSLDIWPYFGPDPWSFTLPRPGDESDR